MKRLVIGYVKTLQSILNSPGILDLPGAAMPYQGLTLELNMDGFPKLPPLFSDLLKINELSKKQLEDILRSYLSQHYSMFLHYCRLLPIANA